MSGALGVAVMSTVVAEVGPVKLVDGHAVADLSAYHAAFLVGAASALLGAVAALTVHDEDAAKTMVRRGRLARRPPDRNPPPYPPPAPERADLRRWGRSRGVGFGRAAAG